MVSDSDSTCYIVIDVKRIYRWNGRQLFSRHDLRLRKSNKASSPGIHFLFFGVLLSGRAINDNKLDVDPHDRVDTLAMVLLTMLM